MSLDTIATSTVVAAVSGAVVGALVGFFKDKAALRFQHRLDERRKLKELQSRYKGRILEAALDWDRRMTQLYDGAYESLDPPDEDRTNVDQYYFQSVVFRFLQLTAIARRFEAEAFYLDPSIAKGRDFDLLRYAKSMLWVMIHAEISPDDGQPGEDHFRSDAFRPLLDFCYSSPPTGEDGKPRGPAMLPETRTRDNELIFDFDRYLAMLEIARRKEAHRSSQASGWASAARHARAGRRDRPRGRGRGPERDGRQTTPASSSTTSAPGARV